METAFLVLGGFGLFIFGMKIMSNGLELIAGNSLQSILQRATANRFFAIFVGIIATIAINSSTAVTIMTVSFVNSGLMSLAQAIGIILGANVGTTFSAQLIAFRLDTFAPLFIFAGIIMHVFFKKRSIKNIGYIILGFGILFFGVTVMGTPLRAFAHDPSFNAILTAFENPVLALLAGFIFTAVVQSSSTTMGLLVTMHLSGVPISFETSAFIILGTNIGTSLTTVFASIPANRESKRAALFHIMFDIIGSTVFGTLIFLFPSILIWFQTTWTDSARQVAMFHTLYNIATLMLLIPFVGQVSLLMQKLIPMNETESSKTYAKKLMYLDTIGAQMMQAPAITVLNAHLELCRMGKIANENLTLAIESFFEKKAKKIDRVFENESVVDYLNDSITAKLVWINNMALSTHEAEKCGKMFKAMSDIERISDHATNIAEYAASVKDNDLEFSDAAYGELKELGQLVMYLTARALDVYENQDESSLPEVESLEEKVDSLSVTFGKNHINRLIAKNCEPKSGVIFTDMLTDLERIADHAHNLAFSITAESKVE